MSSFNSFERFFARVLKRSPKMKSFAKFIYSRFVYYIYKKNYKIKTDFNLSHYDSKRESFFGYYDKSPTNSLGLILAHLVDEPTYKLPGEDKPIEVALFNPSLTEIIWSNKTLAFNWQQGARLHWLDDKFFIYNDYDPENKSYISKVVDSETLKLIKVFNHPVQDSYKLDYFISLNYRRLMALRPDYGYRNLPALSDNELEELGNDGVWKVNFDTGRAELIFSLKSICEFEWKEEFNRAKHKVNHVMISPDGVHFIFLHRYFIGERRYDRLLLANVRTAELKILASFGMVSHCFWVNNNTVLGYMRGPNFKDSYWLIDIDNVSYTEFSHLNGIGDGHPHVHGDWFVTDTYPDKARMQKLNYVSWKSGEVKNLGEFFHGFDFKGESRCDLHPRLSACGKKVFFDSVFSGKRKLYKMEINP